MWFTRNGWITFEFLQKELWWVSFDCDMFINVADAWLTVKDFIFEQNQNAFHLAAKLRMLLFIRVTIFTFTQFFAIIKLIEWKNGNATRHSLNEDANGMIVFCCCRRFFLLFCKFVFCFFEIFFLSSKFCVNQENFTQLQHQLKICCKIRIWFCAPKMSWANGVLSVCLNWQKRRSPSPAPALTSSTVAIFNA